MTGFMGVGRLSLAVAGLLLAGGCSCSPYPYKPAGPRLIVEEDCPEPISVAVLSPNRPSSYLTMVNGTAGVSMEEVAAQLDVAEIVVQAGVTDDTTVVKLNQTSSGQIRRQLDELGLERVGEVDGDSDVVWRVRLTDDMCPP